MKMDKWRLKILCTAILASILFLHLVECKKKKNSQKKPNKNETTLLNFLWLFVYRLTYGVATLFGGQEFVSDFMDGIFVPPNADEGEDGDYRDHLNDDYKDDGDYY